MVLAASLQHKSEHGTTIGGLVAIGTNQYHILQRVGGCWSSLVQIAIDVGSHWEKSEFRL